MLIFLKYLLLSVEVVTCILLIAVVLVQKSKGGGLGAGFGGGASEAFLGAQAGNVLTRITVTLSIVFMLVTLGLGRLHAHESGRDSLMSGYETEAAAPAPVPIPVQAPSAPAGGGPVLDLSSGIEGAAPAGSSEAPAMTPVVLPEVTEIPAEPAASGDTPTP